MPATDYSEEEKHLHQVLGGYKATLTNHRSSEEAKKHAEEMIEHFSNETEIPEDKKEKFTDDEKHLHKNISSHKEKLSNASSTEEDKKQARERLDKYSSSAKSHRLSEDEKHRNHVIGGYKATLSNDKSSEEAKKHAQEMLDKVEKGEELPESERRRGDMTEEEKHRHHVEGGYKATLSNDNASEEAKKHAQEMLDKIAKGEELPESERSNSKSNNNNKSNNDALDTHVAGGYKATLSNPNASEEAKKHAQEMLDKAGVDADERLSGRRDDLTEEEKHRHHVEGGYKATLSNDSASEEAKKHAQEMLDKIAKGEELPESEKRGLKRSSDDAADSEESGKGKQGFASMPKEKVQEIASKGGRTSHAGEEPAPKKGKAENSKETTSQSAK